MNITQGYSSGGSSAQNYSQNYSQSASNSYTNGTAASALSAQYANEANQQAIANWTLNAAYNSEEAEKTRNYNTIMANSTIQRTIADMKAAGINPILAASAGFSADSVNSGAMASNTAPNAYMATATADSYSSSQSYSEGYSKGSSSSWESSQQGQLTAAKTIIDATKDFINSSSTLKNVTNAAENSTLGKIGKELLGQVGAVVKNATKGLK